MKVSMHFITAMRVLAVLTLLCGVVYPGAVGLVAVSAFPTKATGSLIVRNDVVLGSELVGQSFDDPGYFWPRPSASAYDGLSSGGSNVGPLNPALKSRVELDLRALLEGHPGLDPPLPPLDLVTASGSGLDPHVTPEAAHWQVARVARVRRLPDVLVRGVVDAHTDRSWSILGGPRVNVLMVNLALDDLVTGRSREPPR